MFKHLVPAGGVLGECSGAMGTQGLAVRCKPLEEPSDLQPSFIPPLRFQLPDPPRWEGAAPPMLPPWTEPLQITQLLPRGAWHLPEL